MTTITPARPSPLAGMWYPGNPDTLRRNVLRDLDAAELPELPGQVVALISPHAGHQYSGPVAAYAFAAVRGRRHNLVALLSPMHQPYMEPLLTTAHQAYATPLGDVPVDRAALNSLDASLRTSLGFGLSQVAYDREHSLEIELPFLQCALQPGFQLLPVMVRSQDPVTAETLGRELAKTIKGRNALLVASTDLSHFYDQQTATELDTAMLNCFERFDPQAIFDLEESGKGQACGHAAVASVLWAAKELGADTVKTLRHATSGDVTGDYDSVVGYGAAVVLKAS